MTSPEEWQKYIEESRRQRSELLWQMLLIVVKMPSGIACKGHQDELLQQMLQPVGAMPGGMTSKEYRDELLRQLFQLAEVIQANTDGRNKARSQPSDTDGQGKLTIQEECSDG